MQQGSDLNEFGQFAEGATATAATSPTDTKIIMGDDETAKITIKETKPIIDNLEYFPIDILENIFAKTDDVGLLCLSEISNQFAAITPIGFKRKYANKYFVINGERFGGDPKIYSALFNRFGRFITAIQLNHVYIDYLHWIVPILQEHISHIERITLFACHFNPNRINQINELFVNITQLVLRNVTFPNNTISLEFRNLKKLEIRGTNLIDDISLRRIIRDNPTLESLILCDIRPIYFNIYQLIAFMADHLTHIKELALQLMIGMNLNGFQLYMK